MALVVWTIGHSTRAPDAFLDLLEEHGVRALADVRTVPRSKRHPWTAIDALPQVLAARGIAYAHFAALGGLRKPRPDSPNAAWRNESFRGYADHMATPAFRQGVDALLDLAARAPTAVMCAEAVPWRCHRSLLSDALAARGVEVRHILDGGARRHEVTAFARVRGDEVTYPAVGGAQSRLPLG